MFEPTHQGKNASAFRNKTGLSTSPLALRPIFNQFSWSIENTCFEKVVRYPGELKAAEHSFVRLSGLFFFPAVVRSASCTVSTIFLGTHFPRKANH